MASGGGGFGRGRLLQQLKLDKPVVKPEEKEEVKKEEKKEEKKIEIKEEPKSLIEEEPPRSSISALPETKPRFMGRGSALLSVLEKAKKTLPEPTTAIGDTAEQVKKSPLFARKIITSEGKPPSPTTPPSQPSPPPKLSPTQAEAPKPSVPATSGLQQRPSILLSKGRGKLATAVKPEDIPERTMPAVPILQPDLVKPSMPAYKPPSVEASGAGDKKSSISAGAGSTGRTTSQLASDTSQRTMEKATEELIKVEEVKRVSPVTRIGTSGSPADLGCNYIKLKCKNAGVYQYVVHFDPPVEAHSSRMRMVGSLKDVIGTVRLFDGHTLFLPKMLKETVTIVKTIRPTDQAETTLRIQLTKILPPEQIPPVVFNIIFRNVMNELKMKQIGQHYFNPMKHIPIPKHNLDIWPGYITAVHEFQDGLYLVADVAHKVIRSETVLNFLMDLRKRNVPNLKEEATNQLVGCIVLTPYNNRTYKIDDILWDLNPKSKFMYHDGQECSYADYYKNHYGIDISDLNQPLLLNRGKKTKQQKSRSSPQTQQQQPSEMICLIPELCCMTGLTDEIRKDFRAMKDMANHTRITPNDRYKSLVMFIDSIKSCPNAYRHIQNWGLELDDDIIGFEGRVLNREEIHTRKDTFLSSEQCDWNREITRKEVLQAVDIRNWMIVFTRKDANIAEKFVEMMYGCSKQMGIRVDEPCVIQVPDDRADTYVREIKKSLNDQTQLVLIVFPTARDDRYAAVKRLCCIECPVPSQCVNAKTIFEEKTLRSVTQKIMLQINCKLGGELWRLSIPIQRLMVVGIDVYHQIEKKYKSIAGFVSSLNNDQTRWYTKVCFQMTGQELVDSLKIAFMQSLKKYQEVNNCLPEKIIIYRDGVSDGQLTYVTEHEVQQLRSCFGENYSPKLAVCIVQKRINTRIFLESRGRNREFINAPPGAIVDHIITRRDLYDFFLVSQHVRQGTVTPTHYIIVYDDTSFQPDHMQRLSYKLTHLYYNWPGTIRVPAPCQYAHKVAYLTGQYLQKEPDPALCNRLFYL